jgi:hypothetical protein
MLIFIVYIYLLGHLSSSFVVQPGQIVERPSLNLHLSIGESGEVRNASLCGLPCYSEQDLSFRGVDLQMQNEEYTIQLVGPHIAPSQQYMVDTIDDKVLARETVVPL